MKWMIPLIIALPLVVVACDSDDDSDSAIEPEGTPAATMPTSTGTESTGTPDTGATGGTPDADNDLSTDDLSVDLIRQLIGTVSDIDPQTVNDVQLEGDTLMVMLEDQSVVDSAELNSACSDLNDALGFTDLEIVIESGGSELARCSFTG